MSHSPLFTRRRVLKQIGVATFAAPYALASFSAAGQQPITVRVARNDYFELTGFGQYSGSLEKDLAAKGHKATFSAPAGSFAALAPAFTAGHFDIALTTVSSIFGALSRSPNFKVFAAQSVNANNYHHVILVSKDSTITTAKQLEGRSIAVNKGGTGEYLLKLAIDKYQLDATKINVVYLAPPAAATAFASGQVDAWATFSSFAGNAIGKNGARVLASGLDLNDKDDVILLVSDEFLKTNPKVVREVFESLQRESVRNAQNPADTVASTVRYVKVDPSVADYLAKDLKDRPALSRIDEVWLKRFEDVADVYRQLGVVKGSLNLSAHVVDVATL